MFDNDRLTEMERRRKEWEEGTLKPALERFGAEQSPRKFYTPLDVKDYGFLEKVGFPREYPFTADVYATPAIAPAVGVAASTRYVRKYSPNEGV